MPSYFRRLLRFASTEERAEAFKAHWAHFLHLPGCACC
jgi:hypothetical protein